VRAPDLLGARPRLHAKNLMGLLLGHFAARRRAALTSSSASHVCLSPRTGSWDGSQLMVAPRVRLAFGARKASCQFAPPWRELHHRVLAGLVGLR
jgi:hypothetical protein